MKIESDKKSGDGINKALTIVDVKAYLAKLELLGVADTTRVKARTTIRNHVYELTVDTDDVRPPAVGEPGHEKWPGGLR
jgi:hypothetical protein